MPLSEPTDANPIVKEPPVFQDGVIKPSNDLENTLDHSSTVGEDVYGLAYDPANDELIAVGSGLSTAHVFDGLSTSLDRTISLAVNADSAVKICLTGDGHLLVITDNLGTIAKLDKTDGSLVDTIDISGTVSVLEGIDVKDGNLYALDSDAAGAIHKFVGISNTLDSSINISPFIDFRVESLTWFDELLIFMEQSSADSVIKIHVLDGFLASEIEAVELPQPDLAVRDCTVANEQTVINRQTGASDWETEVYGNKDDGQNFTGNSAKILEMGKIYSFHITGPNTITDPTLNDDGQGQFGIVLPGGASVPVGSLSGALDFLFNGSNYVLQTITEGLAKAIYNFQDAVKDNMTATTDPGTGDDADDGYSIRSRWYNTNSGEAFLCVDPSAGAAVWVKASLTLDELGSAATEDVGTAVDSVVQLEDVGGGTPGYPAVDGSQITNLSGLQKPGSSIDPGLAFDTWRTPNADRPTFISASVGVQTDGTTSALAKVEVDESGGTTPDYVEHISADSDTGNNVFEEGQFATVIPAGGSYRIVNSDDPDGNNQIRTLREFTL